MKPEEDCLSDATFDVKYNDDVFCKTWGGLGYSELIDLWPNLKLLIELAKPGETVVDPHKRIAITRLEKPP